VLFAVDWPVCPRLRYYSGVFAFTQPSVDPQILLPVPQAGSVRVFICGMPARDADGGDEGLAALPERAGWGVWRPGEGWRGDGEKRRRGEEEAASQSSLSSCGGTGVAPDVLHDPKARSLVSGWFGYGM
jgi:hypothetical protein